MSHVPQGVLSVKTLPGVQHAVMVFSTIQVAARVVAANAPLARAWLAVILVSMEST